MANEEEGSDSSVRIPILGADVKLQIDADKVNKIVAAAILSSGIGDTIKKTTDEFINDKSDKGWFQQSFKRSVELELSKMVVEIMKEPSIRDQLREKLKAHLTNASVDAYLKKIVDEKLTRGY